MKRNVFLTAALALFLLAGCGCQHEWQDASCTAPKTCINCQETEGESIGHNWRDASCMVPKTCIDCQATEGETIDHSSKDAIEAARKAYDALTPGSKKYVQNLSILTEAEAIYAELGMNPTTLIIIIAVAGGVLLAAAAVVVILVLKKKKAAVPAEAEETAEEETPAEPEA